MHYVKAKGILSRILVLVTVITNSFYVCASEIETEAAYDLEKGGIQTFFIQNEDGEIDVITIEKVVSKARMDAGTYKVVCEASSWTAGFYLIIADNQIQAVYSPFHSTLTGKIINSSLIQNSNVKATYAFVHQVTLVNFNTGVIATISNSQLKVSKI